MALIFDLDGVIVDSNAIHTSAWIRYLALKGLKVERVGERMQGKHNGDIVRDFFGKGLSPDEIAAHGAAKERLFREMMLRELPGRLVPGVLSFLGRHRDAPMAVASNAEPLNVDFVLGHQGLRDYFRVVVSAADVRRPKPDPEVYLLASRLLGMPAANCVVFEDSAVGTRAARAAGARVVGIRTTSASLPDVDFEADDFADPRLEAWLGKQEAA